MKGLAALTIRPMASIFRTSSWRQMPDCIKFIPDHSLNLNVRASVASKPFREHTHDCTELAIVFKGSAKHIINGRPHLAKAGDVYVIKPGSSHGFADTNDFSHYVFSYMPDMLEPSGADMRGSSGFQALFAIGQQSSGPEFNSMLRLSLEDLAKVRALVEAILAELSAKRPCYEAMAKALFSETVAFLSRRHEEQEDRSGTPLDVDRAARLASRLERRFMEPLNLQQAAKELGVSERQLRRIFHRHYGVSPVDYLMRTRVNRATELMNSSDMTLAEIAFACGFTDANYLSRQVKKATGLPPTEWRARRHR